MLHEIWGFFVNVLTMGVVGSFFKDWAIAFFKKTTEDFITEKTKGLFKKLKKNSVNEETMKLKLELAEEKIKRLEAELELERLKNHPLPPSNGGHLKRVK